MENVIRKTIGALDKVQSICGKDCNNCDFKQEDSTCFISNFMGSLKEIDKKNILNLN